MREESHIAHLTVKDMGMLPERLTAHELITTHHTPPPCVIEEWLPVGGMSLLAAHPKAGKSTLVRNIMKAVSEGRRFFQRAVEKGVVIYYALEEHRHHVAHEMRVMGMDTTEIITRVGPIPKAWIHEVIELDIKECKADLVVIDPLFDAIDVQDGNGYALVNTAMKSLLYVARATGCHILTVHHANKGDTYKGSMILGSQALAGSTDCNMFLTVRRDDTRVFETEQRIGRPFEPTTLQFDPITHMISLAANIQEERLKTLREDLLEALDTRELTNSSWRSMVRGRNADKGKAIEMLEDQGLVESVPVGKTTLWRRRMSESKNSTSEGEAV